MYSMCVQLFTAFEIAVLNFFKCTLSSAIRSKMASNFRDFETKHGKIKKIVSIFFRTD